MMRGASEGYRRASEAEFKLDDARRRIVGKPQAEISGWADAA
jgi:hypothetical protein